MKPKEKNCVICEKKFKPKVANSLCCSDKCRSTRDAKYEKSRKKRDWAAYEKTRTRDPIKKNAYMKKYYKLHKDEIKLCEVKYSNSYITVHKDMWSDSLVKAMDFYIQKEEYEKCSKIKKLIDKL